MPTTFTPAPRVAALPELPGGAIWHPRPDDKGKPVKILAPSTPSPLSAWTDSQACAAAVPDSPMVEALNGIPFAPWEDVPATAAAWHQVSGQLSGLNEPAFKPVPGKKLSAGVVIKEADGRIWLVAPTNAFGGYINTFPKGTIEDGMSPQATAIKEAHEEAGLRVEITGFLLDAPRSTSLTRYYLARRIGGNPAQMGWESRAVRLVPPKRLYDFLNSSYDYPLAEALGVGKKG